ncbi:hypothetical protein VCRA2113O322_20138 [Vibrio crassostreae]|nr:hypothetical protein VCRA2113O322_20138 [Vibrio crassostreae]CAK3461086.1 hypothetical protein VCRA2120O332_20071 [Vibrio crassostreae]
MGESTSSISDPYASERMWGHPSEQV